MVFVINFTLKKMKRYILILVSLLAPGLEAQSQKHTISGYVQDAASGEQLLGVNVIWQDQLQGTTTNTYGFYSLTLPEGEVEICLFVHWF